MALMIMKISPHKTDVAVPVRSRCRASITAPLMAVISPPTLKTVRGSVPTHAATMEIKTGVTRISSDA